VLSLNFNTTGFDKKSMTILDQMPKEVQLSECDIKAVMEQYGCSRKDAESRVAKQAVLKKIL